MAGEARSGAAAAVPLVTLGLAVLTVALVVVGFPVMVAPARTAKYFAWTIDPPLTAAFLGTCYWTAALFVLLSRRRRVWASVRAGGRRAARDRRTAVRRSGHEPRVVVVAADRADRPHGGSLARRRGRDARRGAARARLDARAGRDGVPGRVRRSAAGHARARSRHGGLG